MNLLDSRAGRRVLFTALYASEGAPVGYIWWALPTKLAAAGLSPSQVALFTAPLVLPWSLKFLWAPLVDTLQSPRWGLRAWIVAAQAAMGLTLLPAFGLSFAEHYELLGRLFLLHAVMAATQDVAVDALCVRSTPRAEQGAINGWMQVGYLTSRAVFGGAILYFESHVLVELNGFAPAAAEKLVLAMLLACIWFSMLLVIFGCRYERPPASPGASGPALHTFVQTLLAALLRRTTLLGLAFALIGGAAFEVVGAMSRPLLVERGLSEAVVGAFTIRTVIAMAAGALAGGWLADRLGRVRFVEVMLVAVAANVVVVAQIVGSSPADVDTLRRALVVLYGLIGAFTASSYGLFMSLTDRRLGATQFSAFMAATNLCEWWTLFAAGRLSEAYGYSATFKTMAVISLLGLLLLWALSRERPGTPISERGEGA